MGKERYWQMEGKKAIGLIEDLVDEEVALAMQHMNNKLSLIIGTYKGKLVLDVYSIEMPEDCDTPGELWGKEFDLLEALLNFVSDYGEYREMHPDEKTHLNEIAGTLETISKEFRKEVNKRIAFKEE